MSDAEMIAELRRLDAERTQGEWTRPYVLCLDDEYAVGVERGDEENSSFLLVCDMNEEPDEYAANAAFIAAVANALPRLLTLAEAGLRAEEMREALQELLPPEYGVSGGPFVGAKCIYEDGSDENTARHRGWISHEAVARARKAMEPSHG